MQKYTDTPFGSNRNSIDYTYLISVIFFPILHTYLLKVLNFQIFHLTSNHVFILRVIYSPGELKNLNFQKLQENSPAAASACCCAAALWNKNRKKITMCWDITLSSQFFLATVIHTTCMDGLIRRIPEISRDLASRDRLLGFEYNIFSSLFRCCCFIHRKYDAIFVTFHRIQNARLLNNSV